MNSNSAVMSVAALGLGLLLAGGVSANQVEYNEGVFSPERGVLCDRNGNWCADGTGLSATWTETYLGHEAAHAIRHSHPHAVTFSNGVTCHFGHMSCRHRNGNPAHAIQTRLFGG